MTELGERLLRAPQEARAIARGEMEPGRVFTPPSVDVAEIRRKTGLSQERFAQRFGFSPAAVRDWEQKRRTPRCRSQDAPDRHRQGACCRRAGAVERGRMTFGTVRMVT